MDQSSDFARVLTAFATYGFRKASMSDLAGAAGVSRQTLYNRFQDKQAVLAWAVGDWAQASEAAACAALDRPGLPATERLVGFFSEWLGATIPMLRSLPHGAEIFEMANALFHDGDADMEPPQALIRFLVDQSLVSGPGEAEEAAFVLILASKGLLLKVADADAYAAGMDRVVRYLLDSRSPAVIAAK